MNALLLTALLLSGHLDPATPPRMAEEARAFLPDATHVVVGFGSHSFSGMAGCVDRLMSAFVAAGGMEGLDTACVSSVKRPPWK